jgi:hypothetical protein
MTNQATIVDAILTCVDSVNRDLPPADRIARAADTRIAGTGSAVPSLTLINLILEVEDAVAPLLGKRIDILDGAASGDQGLRFSSIQDLAAWIANQPS